MAPRARYIAGPHQSTHKQRPWNAFARSRVLMMRRCVLLNSSSGPADCCSDTVALTLVQRQGSIRTERGLFVRLRSIPSLGHRQRQAHIGTGGLLLPSALPCRHRVRVIGCDGAWVEQDGISVGIGPCDVFAADVVAGAWLILNEHLLAPSR